MPSETAGWTQLPAESQVSAVQALPSSAQGWPVAASVYVVALRVGSQISQSLAGLWSAPE